MERARALAVVFLLGTSGCESPLYELAIEGCPAPVFIGEFACSKDCQARRDTVFEARDTPECRFVGWAGRCASISACRAQDTGGVARYERVAWPLDLDLSEANGFDVLVTPGDALCSRSCRQFIPAGKAFSLRARAPAGSSPVWLGDCDSVAGDTCLGVADRVESVRLRSMQDFVSITLRPSGDGTVVAGGQRCSGPSATCAVSAIRGTVLTATALPSAGHVLESWSDPACPPETECSFLVEANLEVEARFAPARSLRLTGRGPPGRVILNGTSEALPLVEVFPMGTEIRLAAAPGSLDDVFFRFEGLPCREPRLIDECAFRLDDHATGNLAFVRFHQWAVGGWNANLCNLESDDAGVTMTLVNSADVKLPPSTNADVLARLDADGGLSVLNAGHFSGGGAMAFRAPDGKRWVTAIVRRSVGSNPIIPLYWGSWDAGIPSRGFGDREVAFVGLDDQFQADTLVVPPLAPNDDAFDLASGRGPLVPSPSGDSILAAVGWGVADGGGSQHGRLMLDTATMQVRGFWPDPVRSDLALVGSEAVYVSAMFGATRNLDSCVVPNPGEGTTVVALLDAQGACRQANVASVDLDGGHRIVSGLQLVRGSPNAISWFEELGTLPSMKLRYVGVNGVLGPRWEHEINAAPVARYATVRALHVGTQVVSFSKLQHAGPIVVSSGATSVACPAASLDWSLVVFRHRLSDGAADWGTCLAASDATATRFGNGGVCTFTQPIRAFGGILVGGNVEASSAAQVHFGSAEIDAPNGGSAYVMLVTPPTEL